MTDAGHRTISRTVQKTNEVLKEIERVSGWPEERRGQSYDALRAVLHALRDRLPVEEAAQLAAQLPTLIRGIYYEGWDPSRVPIKMSREEFLERVRKEFPFQIDGDIEDLVRTVLSALRRYVTEGEMEEVRSTLPKDLQELVA